MRAERNADLDGDTLVAQIRDWGRELGFQHIGISDIDLTEAEGHLFAWLRAGYHGEMRYMQSHGTRRSRPADLVEGTQRVISVRMNYLPTTRISLDEVLQRKELGAISRYALGRDYHKLIRRRLQTLTTRIETVAGPHGYRVFTDSAPVLEKALAQKAGLGWIGKHTNLIARDAGSWFFLGEIYTDLPLPLDTPARNHCGDCHACIDACPTGAIVAPYTLDARRCISYLTIEHPGAIPEPLRPMMGNRIYGCDDCQMVCPWNRFAQESTENDFLPRHGLDAPRLLDLFAWTDGEFLARTEGSAIRRIGYERWLRNIAVALGNAEPSVEIDTVLHARSDSTSPLVREHVRWALTHRHAPV